MSWNWMVHHVPYVRVWNKLIDWEGWLKLRMSMTNMTVKQDFHALGELDK